MLGEKLNQLRMAEIRRTPTVCLNGSRFIVVGAETSLEGDPFIFIFQKRSEKTIENVLEWAVS